MNQKEYRAMWSASSHGRANKLFHNAKHRSKRTGGKVSITQTWIENKLNCGICELTGLRFDLKPAKKGHANPYAPSLDRKNSENRDYSEENTRVVLQAVNVALNEHAGREILPILKALVFGLEKHG